MLNQLGYVKVISTPQGKIKRLELGLLGLEPSAGARNKENPLFSIILDPGNLLQATSDIASDS